MCCVAPCTRGSADSQVERALKCFDKIVNVKALSWKTGEQMLWEPEEGVGILTAFRAHVSSWSATETEGRPPEAWSSPSSTGVHLPNGKWRQQGSGEVEVSCERSGVSKYIIKFKWIRWGEEAWRNQKL